MSASSSTPRRRLLATLACLVLGALLARPAPAADALPIAIGIPPALLGLPVHYAQEQGYFREAGLDVRIVTLTAGSAAVPQLLGGQLQFAAVDSLVTLVARSKNIPVLIAAPNTVGIAAPERGYGNLVVGGGSPVKSLKDLPGRVIAVNQLNGSAWALAKATLDRAGVDSAKVQFLEVPPPQMLSILQQGRADAAVVAEPIASLAAGQGMRVLANIEAATVAANSTFSFAVSETWARANPETVRKFAAAMLRANRELNASRERALATAARTSGLAPAVLANVHLPLFAETPLTADGLQKVAEIAVKYGLVTADRLPPLDSVVIR